MARMKVLVLSHKSPYPAIDGGCVAIKNMANNLLELGFDVKMLALSTFKHPFEADAFPEGFLEKTAFKAIEVDTKLNVIDAFSNLVTADSYNVSRFFSAEVEENIQRILLDFSPDIVLLESLFMTPYLSTVKEFDTKIKVILRSHNLEYLIWQRHKDTSGNPLKKMYLGILVKQLRKYELSVLNDVHGVLAISQLDLQHYKKEVKSKKPIFDVIPLGINFKDESVLPVKSNAFFHLGAMDWEPNLQGMYWFLKEVWPLIIEQEPEATLTLGGKNIDQYTLPSFAENMNINIVPYVENAKTFMQENGIMLVPITIAGGIRIKIVEGMSYGVPVLSTTTGAEGINAKDSSEIMLGKDAKDMANKALKLLRDPSLVLKLQEQGKKFSETHFNNSQIKVKLNDFLTKVYNGKVSKK